METTIIALAIALAAMVLIAVFAVAYCYKVQEKCNQLQNEITQWKKLCATTQNDFAEYMEAQQTTKDGMAKKIKDLEHDIAKKDEEISDLKNEIEAYKEVLKDRAKEIVQHKNHIAELEQDNTLLWQQLAECKVPTQTLSKTEDKPVFNAGDEVELIEDYGTNIAYKGYRGFVIEDEFNSKSKIAVKFMHDWYYIPTRILKHAEPSKPISEPVIETTDPKEDYIAKQKQWVKENKVKNGTPVILFSPFEDYENGFDAMYCPYIDKYIGKKGRVIMVEDGSISVQFKDDYWFIPYFCLEINRRKR